MFGFNDIDTDQWDNTCLCSSFKKPASCTCVVEQSVTSIYEKLAKSVVCQVQINFLQSYLTPMKSSPLPQVSQVTERLGAVTHWDPFCLQSGSTGVEMTFIAKTFYDLKATTLEGDSVDFNVYRGRVVLIENVASLWGTTTRDFSELNLLQSKYPHRLVVLGFPCNQFGYQVSWTAQHHCTRPSSVTLH